MEALHLWEAMEQATADAATDTGEIMHLPAVFHRKNGKPWVVIMELSQWIRLYVLSGLQWRDEAERKTYGELYTEVLQLRAANETLRARVAELGGDGRNG